MLNQSAGAVLLLSIGVPDGLLSALHLAQQNLYAVCLQPDAAKMLL